MKLLYLFPALLYCCFLALIGLGMGFGGLMPVAWVYAALLIVAAILLGTNQWWGSIPGMTVGGIIIYMFERSHVHHHINENPIGIGIILYFAVMGLICYKTQKKRETK